MWQPVGRSGSKWWWTIGKMVKSSSFVHISDSWKKVPLEKNELFFDALMVSVIKLL